MKVKIGNKTFEVSKEVMESNPEEIVIDFDGTLRSQDEDSVFIENHKKEARKEGVQIAVKEYRDEFGFQGRSIDKLIEAVKSKTLEDAKIEPEEKLKKIQTTLEEKENALQNALNKVSEKENEFKTYKNQNLLDKKLNSYIPENTILPKEDIKVILKNRLSFDVDEDGNILALDSQGNIIKDKTTANPKDAKDVVSSFFQDNQSYLKPIEGGSGAGDSGKAGKKKTIDDFIKEQGEKGISPNSAEFQENLAPLLKDGLIDVD